MNYKIILPILIFSLFTRMGRTFSQNIGVNTDGSVAETGVMLDVKAPATNPKATTAAAQTFFQLKSYDADASALKLRLGFKTDATQANRYGFMEFLEAGTPTYLNLALQPSGGNVGIGTTSPGNKLTVQTAAGADDVVPALGANGGKFALLNNGGLYGLLGGVLGTGNAFLQVQRVDASATAYNLLLQPTAGNVGIGTTSPSAKLTVSASYNPDAIWCGSGTISYPTTPVGGFNFVMRGSSSDFRLGVNDGNGRVNQYWNGYMDGSIKYIVTGEPAGRVQMSVSTNGFWSFYGAPSGTAGNAITWTQGAYIEPNNFIWLSPRGTSSDFYMTSTGNTGIGTTSAAAKLEVDGSSGSTIKIVDGNQGANKILTSDATGQASWQNLSSIPGACMQNMWAKTAAGTYTFTTSSTTTKIFVQLWGGGGGGSNGAGHWWGAGGGGAYASAFVTVTPSTNYVVIVGVGGTGGASGAPTNGGDSKFNTTVLVAGGGVKGTSLNSSTGSLGGNGGTATSDGTLGTGSGAVVLISGQQGGFMDTYDFGNVSTGNMDQTLYLGTGGYAAGGGGKGGYPNAAGSPPGGGGGAWGDGAAGAVVIMY